MESTDAAYDVISLLAASKSGAELIATDAALLLAVAEAALQHPGSKSCSAAILNVQTCLLKFSAAQSPNFIVPFICLNLQNPRRRCAFIAKGVPGFAAFEILEVF